MVHVLCRTVGSWSAGTRVEIVDFNDGFDMLVRVLAGDEPLIDVIKTDLVERRQRAGTITRGVGGGTEGTTAEGTEVQED